MILAIKTFGRTGRGSGLSDACEMAAQLLLELGVGNLQGSGARDKIKPQMALRAA